jgi:hypothetical protein
MSFKKYMVAEVIFFLFVVLTLPLWFPVWLFFVLKDWYADCRYGWECMERNRIHDEARAAQEDAK